MKCPYCGKDVPTGVTSCPACGATVANSSSAIQNAETASSAQFDSNSPTSLAKTSRTLGGVGIVFAVIFACVGWILCGIGLGLAIKENDSQGIKINAIGLGICLISSIIGCAIMSGMD